MSFSDAARNRGVDPRSRGTHVTKLFYKDASGRIRARKSDDYSEDLYIPSTKPGVDIKVPTKGSAERSLVGQWIAAINAAASGDYSKINSFPKNQFVGGVRLPTSAFEVGQILEAMEKSGEKFEGPYRSKVVRA